MLNYVQRIQVTQIALKKTNDFESAIKSLKPPVFWKDKDNFKTIASKWPTKETILNIDLLVRYRIICVKQITHLTNILCERTILISVRSKRVILV
jgi:hypothetical protein